MYHSHERRTRSLESVVSGGWVFYAPTTVRCPGLTNAYQNLLRGNLASVCSASAVRWFSEHNFRTHGEVCHRIDSLLPLGNYSPSYVQPYIWTSYAGQPESSVKDNVHFIEPQMYKHTCPCIINSVFSYISTTENMTASGVTTFFLTAILLPSSLITTQPFQFSLHYPSPTLPQWI